MSENTETPNPRPTAARQAGNPDMRWYVVHAYSGMEKTVERDIARAHQARRHAGQFGQILVPTEEVVEIKNGQKTNSERRFFPGYVLVEMK